ncbi:putative capsule polysaccharide biosynthesis protein [Cryphonectria parasitica EP155]|uniref:Capsule polysaccharide biosynthesis protein n=1 Tax=Cryphonectria parasitica (strain ATCC 38755 / EP155) TaxID=660469 RepID=A0A9P4XRN6_CRYP1|nr:putative capsule polysaccharide biosynthesis protein [Cryphonectria parasitica EP155]KAF3759929.1 putative capsule polysaccharide biosynthesis protein [Cryphonectria parasitica EP155]
MMEPIQPRPTRSTIDQRSDQEILTDLQTFKPVDGSERNIWAFWDTGLANCKPWCQRNIISWVRRHQDWTVRVVDMVEGSANHWSRYISEPALFLPRSLLQPPSPGTTASNTHLGAHMGDLMRLPLLYLHGGVWLDVGFMLFRGLDDLCWNKLADPQDDQEMMGFKMTISDEIAMFFNGLIAARKGCLGVKYWHDIYLACWEDGAPGTAGMSRHPLLRHLPRYEVPNSNGGPPEFEYGPYFDYISHMFCVERLRHIRDPVLSWDGPAYFAKHVLLYECITEVYWAQHLTQWSGRRQFELLSRPRDGAAHNEAYKEAEDFVEGILAMSSTMKFSHGLLSKQREYLARIWDEPGNADADRAPGTWAAHLRWASVYFDQTRHLEPLLFPVRADALLTGGLLEAHGEPHLHWEAEH